MTEEKEVKFERKPIRCPSCNSREIAFVTEYHRCIGLRILFYFMLAVCFVICGLEFSNFIKGGEVSYMFFVFPIILIAIRVIISVIESHTHVLGICRDCGCQWIVPPAEE